ARANARTTAAPAPQRAEAADARLRDRAAAARRERHHATHRLPHPRAPRPPLAPPPRRRPRRRCGGAPGRRTRRADPPHPARRAEWADREEPDGRTGARRTRSGGGDGADEEVVRLAKAVRREWITPRAGGNVIRAEAAVTGSGTCNRPACRRSAFRRRTSARRRAARACGCSPPRRAG